MRNIIKFFSLCVCLLLICVACGEDYLEEKALDRFSPENSLVNKSGFDAYLVTLHRFAREENFEDRPDPMGNGTDVSVSGVADGRFFSDYTLLNSQTYVVVSYWNWAYAKMLKVANLVITRAENPAVNWTPDEKNAVLAEARFFRAYTYNTPVNLYGGVPIIDREQSVPRFDFTRATRQEVLQFVIEDLEFAVEYLPVVQTGRYSTAEYSRQRVFTYSPKCISAWAALPTMLLIMTKPLMQPPR
jgi:hypothetical protein